MRNLTFSTGLKSFIVAMTCVAAFQASADIVISGTRIIYPQSVKDVVISLENRGQRPLLVQTWLDDGRDTTNPQELKLPFVITPLFRASIHTKDSQYVLPISGNLCHKIKNPCSGLTPWKFPPKLN